jgi:hypothetical protein
MGRLRRAIDFLQDNLRSARRGREWRNRSYDSKPSRILGAGAAAPFRDERAWQEVVPWMPVERAMQRHTEWKAAHGLSAEELRQMTRVETRSEGGGEMRVLAAPDVAANRSLQG